MRGSPQGRPPAGMALVGWELRAFLKDGSVVAAALGAAVAAGCVFRLTAVVGHGSLPVGRVVAAGPVQVIAELKDRPRPSARSAADVREPASHTRPLAQAASAPQEAPFSGAGRDLAERSRRPVRGFHPATPAPTEPAPPPQPAEPAQPVAPSLPRTAVRTVARQASALLGPRTADGRAPDRGAGRGRSRRAGAPLAGARHSSSQPAAHTASDTEHGTGREGMHGASRQGKARVSCGSPRGCKHEGARDDGRSRAAGGPAKGGPQRSGGEGRRGGVAPHAEGRGHGPGPMPDGPRRRAGRDGR